MRSWLRWFLVSTVVALCAGTLGLSMASDVSQWSTSASSNNAAPPNGWPEGMARSAVNDSARENMAALASWYQDTNGSLVTAGTSSAYTLTTNTVHAALADQSMLAFRLHVANAASPTLNVDSLGAKALVNTTGTELETGAVATDQIIIVVYNATDDVYNMVSNGGPPVGTTRQTINTTIPSGWLNLNGDSIGSATSGATHANAKYEALYTVFWNSMSDTHAPVATGRGASAAADFAANKALTMPDARGRSIVGTGTGSGLTARTNGDDTIGAEDAIVVAHDHASGTLQVSAGQGNHSHNNDVGSATGGSGTTRHAATGDASIGNTNTANATLPAMNVDTGNTASTGSSGTDANMHPSIALQIIVKY